MRKDKFEDFDFIDFNESRSEESTVMADMIGVLAHHRKWFILSVAVCLLVGFIYVRSTPKTFFTHSHHIGEGRTRGAGTWVNPPLSGMCFHWVTARWTTKWGSLKAKG